MSDETTEEPTEEAGEGAGESTSAVAVLDEAPVEPAPTPTAPASEARAEARRTRFILPLLIPIGAIAVVAFYTLNVSRVFLAAAESNHTVAVLIAAGLTLTILVGATVISALPDIRTSSLVLGLCGVMAVVLLAGSLVLGASEPHEEGGGGYVEPAGEAINTLAVDALPELRFGLNGVATDRFEAPAGINLIDYIDQGGTHTLLFAGEFPGFKLAVPGGPEEGKVDLSAETTYTIYCDVPGHRAAGMEAEVVVGAAAPAGATGEPGTETPQPTAPVPGAPAPGEPPAPGPSSNEDPAQQSSTGGT
jgi:hypothetical protein